MNEEINRQEKIVAFVKESVIDYVVALEMQVSDGLGQCISDVLRVTKMVWWSWVMVAVFQKVYFWFVMEMAVRGGFTTGRERGMKKMIFLNLGANFSKVWDH